MRIISGLNKGTKLTTLSGNDTRPTLDRVKESLFSILQQNIKNARILDLYSGSGALGLEALSRGADFSVFCDLSYNAIKIIKQNIKKTKQEHKSMVINKDYAKCIYELYKQNMRFDIIFLDPPYKENYAIDSINKILQYNLLLESGIIIIETDNEQLLEEIKKIEINIYDVRKYGRVILIFLNRKG